MGIAHREERSDFIDIQQKACGSVTFLVRGTLFSLPGWSTGRLYNIYFKGSRMERTYQAYGLTNYRNIRQITRLNKEELQAIEVVLSWASICLAGLSISEISISFLQIIVIAELTIRKEPSIAMRRN